MMKLARMRLPLCLLVLALALQGCSRSNNSAVDPRSWFANQEPDLSTPSGGYGQGVVDTRLLVMQVREVDIDPTPGGIIVRAEGLSSTQGYWDADIVRAPVPGTEGGDMMRYEFRVRPPVTPQPVGTERSRIINVADFITAQDLASIRRITVVGSTNSVSRSR